MNTNKEKQKNKKLVLFDFDGVLINTLEFSYKIHTVKNKNFTWKSFQDFSNGNFHDGFDKAVSDGEIIPTDDFYDKYEKELQELTIHDVLHQAVLALSEMYILVIISSTDGRVINNFLKKENLVNSFQDIMGHDFHKSKEVKIKSILQKYNISSKDAVFITDTLGDIKEANVCKVPSIGVTWGLHSRENLEKGNPEIIIDDPMNLFDAIQNVLK